MLWKLLSFYHIISGIAGGLLCLFSKDGCSSSSYIFFITSLFLGILALKKNIRSLYLMLAFQLPQLVFLRNSTGPVIEAVAGLGISLGFKTGSLKGLTAYIAFPHLFFRPDKLHEVTVIAVNFTAVTLIVVGVAILKRNLK